MLKKLLLIFALTFGAFVYADERNITFDLIAPSGKVTEKNYAGKYLLMAIGYTSCPDICPTTLFEFGRTIKAIDNPDALQMLFVTIDPVNDDVERLNSYTSYFDPRIIGLTGEMKNIQAFSDQVGGTFGYRLNGKKVESPQKGMSYTVYHSALIYLISPERKIVDVYDYQIGEKGLIDALNKELPQKDGSVKEETFNTENTTTGNVQLNCALPEGFEATKKLLLIKDFIADYVSEKPVLLNLWALWCSPCREELPLFEQHNATDFVIETLNLGDTHETITKFFNEFNLKKLSSRTTSDNVLERLGAVGLPFSVLFVEGKQVASKAGIIGAAEMKALAEFSRCQNASSKP